ncbi:unnamed protein product [Peronospora destructor]|uniref:3-deoxy-7-phosphoheptulonate synthase n=1 Tax=Peronospora destructor TaxID=86335 RepID=A0AAV0TJV5_9STRA|nr:unnamed protein product [Peronospora destructor]
MPSCFTFETGHAAKRQCLKDRNVLAIKPLMPPACVLEELPVSPQVYDLVNATRTAVSHILHDHDNRLVAVVGPCSIHDTAAALDYAKRLKALADELKGELVIIMRTYFEKPRTTVGWKGLINDPDLDASSEFLDTISPQFTADLVSWGAIGARTTESQLHRELTSGLSMPMGFKNGTGGDLQVAVDATVSSSQPHTFLGLDENGIASIVRTRGNKDCHVILRGGSSGPNFKDNFIEEAVGKLVKAKQPYKIMVDCSHGNSRKQHAEQANVSSYLADIVAEGNTNLLGIMIESNIVEGNHGAKKSCEESIKAL